MQQKINAVRQNISCAQAEAIVQQVCGAFVPQVQKRIYYPYLWASFEYTVRVLRSCKRFTANCVVDLINQVAALTGAVDTESIHVPAELVLEHWMKEEDALKIAKSNLIRETMLKMKSLLFPDIEMNGKIVVYKPFWIVRCEDAKGICIQVLVDAVTGGYEILNSHA